VWKLIMHSPITHRSHGFSLIEVLVSVLILAIGLLGLAGLQLNSMRNNHSAYLRTQATILSAEISDRMRANRTTALAGNYLIAATATPTTPPNCEATVCSETDIARYDLAQWKGALATLLPTGDGSITQDANAFTVRIFWDDLRSGVTGTGCDPDNANDLKCFSVSFQP